MTEPRVPSDAESRLLRISVLRRTREINILACELNISNLITLNSHFFLNSFQLLCLPHKDTGSCLYCHHDSLGGVAFRFACGHWMCKLEALPSFISKERKYQERQTGND